MSLPPHLKPVADHIRGLPIALPPAPWIKAGAASVGGLTDVGFARGSDILLVISSQGRGLFDCLSGLKIARDPDDLFDFDTANLEAPGMGVAEGISIHTAGLHGGGLARLTNDGWCAEQLFIDWPDASLLLVPPGSWIFGKAFNKISNYTKLAVDSTVRAWGFSPTGKSLVIATSSDLIIYCR
jgi:hypothetical protein